MAHHQLPSAFPDVLCDVTFPLQHATRRLTELTIISLCLSTGIIILTIVASLDVEGCFFALLASALTMTHNATTLFLRSTFARRQRDMVAGLGPPKAPVSANKFMVNSLYLFMIPLWFVAVGWMIASLYFMGLEILEKWQWGPAIMVIWPLKFTLIGLEIAVLCSMGRWGMTESREAVEGHVVEIRWYDGEFY